jgi:hypothetical protein
VVSNQRKAINPDSTKSKTGSDKASGQAVSVRGTGNLSVGLSIVGALLAILIAFKPLTPVLLAVPILPFYYRAMRKGAYQTAFSLTLRWILTVFVTIMLFGGFLSDRTEKAVPFATQTQTAIQNWTETVDAPPPADYIYLAGGLVIFAAAALVSGGAGGFVVGALGLASSACGAAFLFQRGGNIFQVLIIAVPPWLLCLFGACLFLMVPITVPFFNRLSGRPETSDGLNLRHTIYLGLGLLAGSLLLRLTVAGIWAGLTQRWTVI